MSHRRSRKAVIALTLSAALTASLGTAGAVTGDNTGPGAGAGASGPDGTGGAASAGPERLVTLITGDRVAVGDAGEVVSFTPAEGREGIPVRQVTSGGSTLVLPLDAAPLVAEGTLDQRLFDTAELSRAEYDEITGLPVIVTYAEDSARTLDDHTEVRAHLESINGEAVTVTPENAPSAWGALTAPDASGGDGVLTTAPGITSISLDGVSRAALDESAAQIGAPDVWDAGFDGTGVTIAVLDTGISRDHEDVASKIVGARNFSASPDPDADGHGTHVASTAAGTGAHGDGSHRGVAPGADLLDGKVLDDSGSGFDSAIIEGMEWAVEEGADIVNLSLGSSGVSETAPMDQAVNRLSEESGTLFVVAAGNSGPGAATLGSPGTAEAALTLGAVDKSGALASFSSSGPRPWDAGVKPDVTAPGVDIGAAASPGSTIERDGTPVADGYAAVSGTSMATPHAAGAAALLAQANPEWTGEQLKAALVGSARPHEEASAFRQGSGLIEVHDALTATVSAETGSLRYGTVPWPYAEAAPLTEEITYRNSGERDVTLDLALTTHDPDGAAAPEGFARLGEESITVPAGSTATVPVTVDPSTAGRTGPHGLHVLATGADGESVSTAGGADLREEEHTLSVEVTDDAGDPATEWSATATNTESGARGQLTPDADGADAIDLPPGEYLVDIVITEGGWPGPERLTWLVQPGVELSSDTALTLSTLDGEPVDVTVPDEEADLAETHIEYQATVDGIPVAGAAVTVPEAPGGVRTAQLGPVGDALEIDSGVRTHWEAGEGDDLREYHSYRPRAGSFPTGLTDHLTDGDLAEVTATLAPSASGEGGLFTAPLGSVFLSAAPSALTAARTVYVQADAAPWRHRLAHHDTDGQMVAYWDSPGLDYEGGEQYRRAFGGGVLGPSINGGDEGISRDSNYLMFQIPPLSDRSGNAGRGLFDQAETVVSVDGAETDRWSGPADQRGIPSPEGDGEYHVVTTVDRAASGVSPITTGIELEYTFTSEAGDGSLTAVPVSAVRFAPDLAADSTAPAGESFTVPFTVQTGGGAAHEDIAIEVSSDRGESWEEVEVRDGEFTVENPAAGSTVSLRATVDGPDATRSVQTLLDAYLTS